MSETQPSGGCPFGGGGGGKPPTASSAASGASHADGWSGGSQGPVNPADMPQVRHTNLTYGSYLKVPELLGLQQPVSVPSAHDEMLFIISHQVYELWFKQILWELEGVCGHLDQDEPLRAAQLLHRVHQIQNLLIEQIPLLETMFSSSFAKFRGNLRPASGFQSVQFRKLEFFLGAKNPRILELVGDDQAARTEMAQALAVPTPYDHFIRHLAREDRGIFNIPKEALERDTSKPHAENPALVEALLTLYRAQDESSARRDANERYWPQFIVAEHLLQLEEKLAIWRFHHVKMVERMIGTGGGTGGSTGAKYLRQTLDISLYPDLWAVRSRLG